MADPIVKGLHSAELAVTELREATKFYAKSIL